MGKRIWYEVWATLPDNGKSELLVKAKSIGLARLVVMYLKRHYEQVEIR